ncbi:MAG TPA: hypothetical protein VF468_06605, partial [Actinomycetota bacterium]|nr:hypothetical protein [Actinomycetota bacterium]
MTTKAPPDTTGRGLPTPRSTSTAMTPSPSRTATLNTRAPTFVPGSRRCADPAAHLLTPTAWAGQRQEFCHLVGKPADPAAALNPCPFASGR